ncbi:EamA family transporter [Neobacillus notoginsengisoli]|uniref:EamA family transporter n=1 Tax=Neobacillus notoginsengisoli TaxID=1578198 RepID=A0A417YSN4_9BACI|nr:DMT family transporter [Neobacillus notoginsengisoli]RHW38999.1 EamA family transporter [Neobacillus notoginsengisoli]
MLKTYHYSLLVFLGACSYGLIAAIIKLAYIDGFTVGEVISSQYFFGWAMLLVLNLLFSRKRIPLKKVVILILAGTSSSFTGIFYGISLKMIPASIAIVLLFQFTWIGILFESIADKRFPSREKIVSVAILLIGTFLASGMVGSSYAALNLKGTIFGLLSAVTFSFFIFSSGRVEADAPFLIRGLSMTTGAMLLLMICFSPSFLYNGSMSEGLWKYGILLGLLGVAIPVIFFAIGSPKTGSGLATILGGAELPTAIIASIIILKEYVSMIQWLGVLLILFGISVSPIKQLWNTKMKVQRE